MSSVDTSRFKNPYVKFVGMPREMKGKGSPKETIFGVLGETKYDPFSRSLGGLVKETTGSKKVKKGEIERVSGGMMTEKGAVSVVPKTKIAGSHHGQVPYPGMYMGHVGKEVS